MATFDQLKTGDLFVCTDSNGVTYKVTWDKIDDIVLPPVGVWHIKDISGGYVNITDYDRIERMDGTNLVLDGSPYRPTSGEYLVYGNLPRFKQSTGNWDFGPPLARILTWDGGGAVARHYAWQKRPGEVFRQIKPGSSLK